MTRIVTISALKALSIVALICCGSALSDVGSKPKFRVIAFYPPKRIRHISALYMKPGDGFPK